MTQLNNTMDIFKLLPKTNCRKCNAPTCLAFAAAVFQNQRQLVECPYVDHPERRSMTVVNSPVMAREAEMLEDLEQLKRQIAHLDLPHRAESLGGQVKENRLVLKIMGKDFAVDQTGRIITDLHINAWIIAPVFDYLLKAKGTSPSGQWVSLRELKNGPSWHNFFVRRCEIPLKQVADNYTDLFTDMVLLFNAKQVENHYDADISVVLTPLPKVPILICYLKPEGNLPSSLNLFWDETVEENLSMQSIYTLGAGMATMFTKIALRHGATITS